MKRLRNGSSSASLPRPDRRCGVSMRHRPQVGYMVPLARLSGYVGFVSMDQVGECFLTGAVDPDQPVFLVHFGGGVS